MEDEAPVTRYPFTPAYAQTIIKAQGQNIQHLIIWLDSALVPAGTAYVGLSIVRRKSAMSLLQPIYADQLTPVQLRRGHHIHQCLIIVSLLFNYPLLFSFSCSKLINHHPPPFTIPMLYVLSNNRQEQH